MQLQAGDQLPMRCRYNVVCGRRGGAVNSDDWPSLTVDCKHSACLYTKCHAARQHAEVTNECLIRPLQRAGLTVQLTTGRHTWSDCAQLNKESHPHPTPHPTPQPSQSSRPTVHPTAAPIKEKPTQLRHI